MGETGAIRQEENTERFSHSLKMLTDHVHLACVAASSIIRLRAASRRIIPRKAHSDDAAVESLADHEIARASALKVGDGHTQFNVWTGPSRTFDGQVVLEALLKPIEELSG